MGKDGTFGLKDMLEFKLLKVCVQAKEVPNPQTMDYTGEKQKLFLKKEKELARESYGFT